MWCEISISRNAPDSVMRAFVAPGQFAAPVLLQVVKDALGVRGPMDRPAEFCVHEPTWVIPVGGNLGVQVRLMGVSRVSGGKGRTREQFTMALDRLTDIARVVIQHALNRSGITAEIQLFCAIVLDGEIPWGSINTSVLEGTPVLVQSATLK